jgi:hypothetical protein
MVKRGRKLRSRPASQRHFFAREARPTRNNIGPRQCSLRARYRLSAIPILLDFPQERGLSRPRPSGSIGMAAKVVIARVRRSSRISTSALSLPLSHPLEGYTGKLVYTFRGANHALRVNLARGRRFHEQLGASDRRRVCHDVPFADPTLDLKQALCDLRSASQASSGQGRNGSHPGHKAQSHPLHFCSFITASLSSVRRQRGPEHPDPGFNRTQSQHNRRPCNRSTRRRNTPCHGFHDSSR